MTALELEVRPASPYRLPRGSEDRTLRIAGGVATRFLHVRGRPVLVRAWQGGGGIRFRAEAVDPARVGRPRCAVAPAAGAGEV